MEDRREAKVIANTQNLIQNKGLTPEERRESASRAGKASGNARKARKLLKDALIEALSIEVKEDKVREQLAELGLDPTYHTAINFSIIKEAVNGNTKAYELIRDTIGEKPTDKVDLQGEAAANPFMALTVEELRKLVDDG